MHTPAAIIKTKQKCFSCNCFLLTTEAIKIITRISEIQALILSSQLKEMLKVVNFQENSQAMNNDRPIRIVYHPSEPFYVFKQV